MISQGNIPIRIVVTKKPTSFVSNAQLKEAINKIIINYFSMQNQKIGDIINITEIYSQILALGYVETLQTKYVPTDDPNNVWVVERIIFCNVYSNINKWCRF